MKQELRHAVAPSAFDDITVSYTYDANGQVTQITDGLGNNWTKAYDALLRNTTITTPSVSGTSYTLTKEYDGNGNITKVTDFKSNATPEAGHSCPANLFPTDRSLVRTAPPALRLGRSLALPDVHNQRTGITYEGRPAWRPAPLRRRNTLQGSSGAGVPARHPSGRARARTNVGAGLRPARSGAACGAPTFG